MIATISLTRRLLARVGVALLLLAGTTALCDGQTPTSPYKVTIRDDKQEIPENQGAVDPTPRLNFQHGTAMNVFVTDPQAGTLQRLHFPMFHVDGNPMRVLSIKGKGEAATTAPLPKSPAGKERVGWITTSVMGDLHVTLTSELVPGKSPGPGQKRQMDAILIRYQIENKGSQSHKVGMRVALSPRLLNNLGCPFAVPGHDKVLDGVELKAGKVPEHVKILERPDLKNPGLVSYLALSPARESDRPDRVVLTRYAIATKVWDMPVAPANGGATLACVYWEPKELRPGGRREMVYGFGKSLATLPEGDCRFRIQLGGSFEPGKLFTIAAVVDDASPGQTLALDLPAGMEIVEGKQLRPIPQPTGDDPRTLVLWKARVLRTGDFSLRVRSSNGLTQTKLISIGKN